MLQKYTEMKRKLVGCLQAYILHPLLPAFRPPTLSHCGGYTSSSMHLSLYELHYFSILGWLCSILRLLGSGPA